MILSIIIPIYNGETTIRRCFESIWSQGIEEENYEVICVNDCSTDNTADIVKQQMEHHNNIRLLNNKENLRAGGSRNYGVKEAKGEYINFIDCDDFYYEGALKKALSYAKDNNLDILTCELSRHTQVCPNDRPTLNLKDTNILTGRQFLINNSLPWGPTRYIFKRGIMIENVVWFKEKCICEDVDWAHKIAFYALRMQYQPILLQHYIIHNRSTTGNEYKSLKTVSQKIQSGLRTYSLIDLYDEEKEFNQIINVSKIIFENSLKYFTLLKDSPCKKSRIIVDYIPKDIRLGKFVMFARCHSLLFSTISTIVFPLILVALRIKRIIWKR